MKNRIVLFFLLLNLILCSVFANQKTYDYNDIEYKLAKYILQVSDLNGPYDTTPISASKLSQDLARINNVTLPTVVKNLYDDLCVSINNYPSLYKSETMQLNLDVLIQPEIYLKVGDKTDRQNWYYGYSDRASFLNLDFEFGWSEYVYGLLSLPYKIRLYNQWDDTFSQNIFVLGSSESYQKKMPFDAGISIGTSFMNFYLGRGQLNMGNGFTGNMFVADNFQYQDFAKLSFYDDFFSYDLTYTHFDQEHERLGGPNQLDENMSFDGEHQIRITHSYVFNFGDCITLAIREGAILQTETAFDLRMINPFIFLHNWNGYDEKALYWANNIMGLDVTASLGGGFRLNLQFVLDQFQLLNEKSSGANDFPNALGGLVNLSNVVPLADGFLENHIEIAYTSPYLYLNNIGTGNENQDFILGYYLTYGNDLSYSGYKYGPDSIVLALGGNYLTYNGGLDVFYTLMYRAHGEHGIKYTNEQNQKPESDLGADWSRDLKLSGTIEHTLLANVGVKYQIHKSFSISTALTYQYKINYNNVAGDWQNLQISIGCSFNPMNFF